MACNAQDNDDLLINGCVNVIVQVNRRTVHSWRWSRTYKCRPRTTHM